MEYLKSLMQSVDDISHTIPDGTYLEMCNNLKSIHELIPKASDPPVTDNRSIPFQAVDRNFSGVNIPHNESDFESEDEDEDDVEDQSWRPEECEEWIRNESVLRRLLTDLKFAETKLKAMKPIQRSTKKVKEAAIKEYCQGFYDIPNLATHTFENLVKSPEWAFILRVSSSDSVEYFKSKNFEKELYDDYKRVENYRIESRISSMRELKRNLEVEIGDVRDRQNYLQSNYNL
jgi:hypothetical protein